jgi:hypothetical protein
LNPSQVDIVNSSKPTNPIFPSSNLPSTPTNRKRTGSLDNCNIFWTPKHPPNIHDSINQLDNLTRDQRNILQKAKKVPGQLTAKQAKLQVVNRRLGNQLEEVKSMKWKLKIAVDQNTLFVNVDGIKKALEEASEAKAETEGRKPQGVAKKAITLGQLEKELRRGSDMLEKAKIESCIFQ